MVELSHSMLHQFRNLRKFIAAILLPATALLVAVGLQNWIPVQDLMRDPAAVLQEAKTGAAVHAYTGMVSSLGILVWCFGASVAAFTSVVLMTLGRDRGRVAFLAAAALFTAVLMFDDLLQIHEVLAYLLNIPDTAFLLLYAGAAVAFLSRFRSEILRTEYVLLFIALVFFAVSLAIDAADPKALVNEWLGPRYHLVEDGPKLLGVCMWAGYYARVCWRELAAPGSNNHTPR